jgi:hypothetical protein
MARDIIRRGDIAPELRGRRRRELRDAVEDAAAASAVERVQAAYQAAYARDVIGYNAALVRDAKEAAADSEADSRMLLANSNSAALAMRFGAFDALLDSLNARAITDFGRNV